MRIVLGLIGLGLIIVALVDVVHTTLGLNRGGPLTARLSHWGWRAALFYHRRFTSHRVLARAGLTIILASVLLWTGLTWAGWTLVFMMDEQSVIVAETEQPADIWERTYFTGYTLITLGLGDYIAKGRFWQILTPIASANGFFLVTLAITYLLPLVSAVVQKRQLALQIDGLGTTADEILAKAWNGNDFGMLSDQLSELGPAILLQGQQYLAYPVLHDFHSPHPEAAVALRIVALDEALSLLEHGVAPEQRLDAVAIYPLRRAISHFLDVSLSEFAVESETTPPLPDLACLRRCGISTVSDSEFEHALECLTDRRRQLLAIVHDDGWVWADTVQGDGTGS